MGSKSSNHTISEFWGIREPKFPSMEEIKAFAKPGKLEVLSPYYLNDSTIGIGIEVEVEGVDDVPLPKSGVWSMHDDGSLRNRGREFITIPIQAKVAPYALQELFSLMTSTKACFSPRTSIHVHVNCCSYTFEQVQNICLLYGVFEPILYRYVGKNRNKNIYCVPIHDTWFWERFLSKGLEIAHGNWRKYTGFNIRPLSEKGTIEFRHMHGTSDVGRVSVWIRLITSLVNYAVNSNTTNLRAQIVKLDSLDSVRALARNVFKLDVIKLPLTHFDDVKFALNTIRLAFIEKSVPVSELFHKELGSKDSPIVLVK